jgi:hypothetical protein
MGKFIIEPHFRLQEWVAEEKDYFRQEGLDYVFRELMRSTDGKIHDKGDKVGAYQSFEEGRKANVSCACHWTVNVAASNGHGKMYTDVYSVAPAGIFVAPDSGIRDPSGLAGVPVSVGYQSGSHYSTLEALDEFLEPGDIELSFAEGLLFSRMEKFIEGEVPAVSVFSGPYYFLEQLGFRKILDTSFMIAAMVSENAAAADVRKYFDALKRAQADIDLHTHRYTHYYKKEFPQRFLESMDTRLFGPGERIVFEPYTRSVYEDTQRWIIERGIFPEGNPIVRDFDAATA